MGGTLRQTTRKNEAEKVQGASRILELLGSGDPPEAFARQLTRRAQAYKRWAERNRVELSEAELWARWMLPDWPAAQVRAQALQLNCLWREAVGVRQVLPEAKDVLIELYRRGYRLGLVSNTTSSKEVPQLLEKLHLAGLFETVVLSCDYGKRKPDPCLLLTAATNMGVAPGRCAYVGNIPRFDVAACRQAGFHTAIILQDSDEAAEPPLSDTLVPDRAIHNLCELVDLFPPRNSGQAYFHAGNGKVEEETPLTWQASLSSMWGMRNFPHIEDFFIAARRLGFAQVELNHQVTSQMLAGIEMNRYRFSSVHEPCPADISVDTLKERDWLVSAVDEDCRAQGVAAIKRSIDLAAELGVDVVVIHAGNVRVEPSLENKVHDLFWKSQEQPEKFLEARDRLAKARSLQVAPRFEATCKSISELLEHARRAQVRLALENRFHYLDIPNPDEMEILLGLGDPSELGFAFDVGHAQTLHRLGYYPFTGWLKRYANRLFVAHLHDVVGIHDHLAPGRGEVDFAWLAPYIQGAVRTIEVQGSNTLEQVKAGLRLLVEKGCVEREAPWAVQPLQA